MFLANFQTLIINLDCLASPISLASRNIGMKRRHINVFSLVIEFANKNNKLLVDAMDKINCIQLEIKQQHSNAHECSFKTHIYYIKACDKKFYRMNKSMVNVLSTFNTILCHAFIKDFTCMPPIVDLPLENKLKSNDELLVHVQHANGQETSRMVDMDTWLNSKHSIFNDLNFESNSFDYIPIPHWVINHFL